MQSLVHEIRTQHTPESLAECLLHEPGLVLLRSRAFGHPGARYSFLCARPFLQFRAFGSECHLDGAESKLVFGNPWHVVEALMARYELLDQFDSPFPLGGCFGYWGYDLKSFVEPGLPRRAFNDLELPDLNVGFYDSVVVFDHHLDRTWVVATGLNPDGSRSLSTARQQLAFWTGALNENWSSSISSHPGDARIFSNLPRAEYVQKVHIAQEYIRAGDIYQVNMAQRFTAKSELNGWELFQSLSEVSPAPYGAYLDCGDFQIASSSPESFLRISGDHIETRPIKGTRPRSPDAIRDAQLTYELQTSPKEIAELVMITDLLRNDLGRVCEYGSVHVPDLLRLERYAQVQHLVSTVGGRLRREITHSAALASCFPGGSVTGAPKIRAMEIIDELEPISRGPYTGCLGYLGFNREIQLSVSIRIAICKAGTQWFYSGAGIVADSDPEAEYEETLAKASGFFSAIRNDGKNSLALV